MSLRPRRRPRSSGGLLSGHGRARRVTGVDPSPASVGVACTHAAGRGLHIDYRVFLVLTAVRLTALGIAVGRLTGRPLLLSSLR